MAKRRRSDSSDTDGPVFIYSTRSSARKSLDASTVATKDHLARETNTPTTEDTVESTDFHNSPSSSRTSSNIIEAVDMQISSSRATKRPPNIKVTGEVKTEDIPVSPVTSKASTKGTPDRPGRTRKPTQKAAELAANSSSKLFKSLVNTQVEADDASYTEEIHRSKSEHFPSDDEATEAIPLSGKTTRKLPKRSSAKKKPSSESIVETEDELASEVMGSEISPSPSRPRGSQYSKEPQHSEKASVATCRSIMTRNMRSKSKTPAVEIHVTSPDSTSPKKLAKPTSKSTRSCIAVLKVGTRNDLPKVESQEVPLPPETLNSAQTKSKPRSPERKTTKQIDLRKSTSPSPNPTTSTDPVTSKPTRIKFKPLQATVSSARDGYTGLPCNLSCLKDSDLFYMWAKISIEHEDLADELCAIEGTDHGGESFEKDRSEEARKVRRRLNKLMAGYCQCGKSYAVNGKKTG